MNMHVSKPTFSIGTTAFHLKQINGSSDEAEHSEEWFSRFDCVNGAPSRDVCAFMWIDDLVTNCRGEYATDETIALRADDFAENFADDIPEGDGRFNIRDFLPRYVNDLVDASQDKRIAFVMIDGAGSKANLPSDLNRAWVPIDLSTDNEVPSFLISNEIAKVQCDYLVLIAHREWFAETTEGFEFLKAMGKHEDTMLPVLTIATF